MFHISPALLPLFFSSSSDGAHIYDQGPTYYRTTFTLSAANGNTGRESTAAKLNAPAAYNTGNFVDYGSASTSFTDNNCTGDNNYSSITTHGTLRDNMLSPDGTINENGAIHIFTTCGDKTGNEPIASSELAGNYYNFYAATAGSAPSGGGVDAPDSLCPYGWQLPANADSGSFNQLVQLYLGRSGNTGSLTQADTALLISPLSFLRSGNYNYSNGARNVRGSNGFYWSRRSRSSTYAYNLGFDSTLVYPQDGYGRGRGFALRCLAR